MLYAAVLAKGFYLAVYLELPFVFGPLFDSQVYLLQARRVWEGRFSDPTLLAFSPGYGFFLAALHAQAGSLLPIIVQLGLGCLNLVLIHRLTHQLFGPASALVAALLYLGYGPLVFFETKIMSETLSMSLLLASLELIARPSFSSARASVCLGAGSLAALAVLTRASLLPALPLLVAAVSVIERKTGNVLAGRWRTGARRALLFAGALLALLGAHGAWTKVHSGLFVPVILVSNTAGRASQQIWTGDLSVFRDASEQDVGAFSVVAQARERLERQRAGIAEPEAAPFSLVGYLKQLPHKALLTFRDQETSFDYGFYGERSETWPLRLAFVSFGMLVTLACVGAVGCLQNRKFLQLAPLIAVALGTLLTTTLFHPSTRYRLPLVVLLLPLAGYAWQLALDLKASSRAFALAGLGLVVLGFATVQGTRDLQNPALWHLRVAESAIESGDFPAATMRLRSARASGANDPEVARRAAMLQRRLPKPVQESRSARQP